MQEIIYFPLSIKLESGQETRSSVQRKCGIQAKSIIRDWLIKYGIFD